MLNKNDSSNPFQGLDAVQVLVRMRELVSEENLNHFRMGLLYNYTVESKLVGGTQYKSALDYFCENIQEVSRASLLAYGAVARAFTEAVCMQLGVTRLKLLLTYAEVAKVELNHAEPGGTFIMVPDEHGGVKPRLFAECSVEELRKALAHLRTPAAGAPIPDEERTLVDQYRESVTSRFAKGVPVRVQLRRHQGKTLVDFKGIPVAQVDKLCDALLEQLYPVREVPEEAQEAPQVA